MTSDMPAVTSRGVHRRLPAREAADRQLSEFCHDLRQPSAASSLLAMAALVPDLPERTQERLTQIAREVGRLSSMVHSALAGLLVWESGGPQDELLPG
jgi:signal transduction histidine kinase